MSFFDLFAGAVLLVSVVTGWLRGGSREVATLLALVVAAAAAVFALRYTAPIAGHAIATPWIAKTAAILVVFVAVYILLRVIASGLTRRLHDSRSLGGVDRTVGAGFGLARALVVLGLANLAINAIMPPGRMPPWITGAALYPVSAASAHALKAFAPQGERLALRVAPVVSEAFDRGDARAGDDGAVPARKELTVRVEKSR